MSTAQPAVTVLMPVYNGERYLGAAIESILGQTFPDFELLIIDDCSTDGGMRIVKGYGDPRIRLVANEANLGVAVTLNRGIRLARGRYIARMDCDDISLPHRLRKQFNFMEGNSEVGVCGSRVRRIGAKRGLWKVQTGDAAIKSRLLFENAMAHPSVMLRTSVLARHDLGYDPTFRCAQDYAFWVELARHSRLANLDEVLLLYRVHPSQISEAQGREQNVSATRVRELQLRNLGLEPTYEELTLHGAVSTYGNMGKRDFLVRAEQWLMRLHRANREKGIFSEPDFSAELAGRWCKICRKSSRLGLWVWKRFRASEVTGSAKVSSGKRADLLFWSVFHELYGKRIDAGKS